MSHAEEVAIVGGTVVSGGREQRAEVLVRGGEIVAVGADLEIPRRARLLDAEGCLVAPALVDLHAHLREPGGERAETIESGSRAAVLGGYSAVVVMPNTDPPIDSAAVVRDVESLAKSALCAIAVAGAITVGRQGEQLAPLGEMAELGVRVFTDDGCGVQDAALMRHALEYAKDLGVVLAEHCEDEVIAAGGQMHEGAWSARLGIRAQPALAEEAMLARDLGLVRLTGATMHFLHLSTARSLGLLAAAKAEGLPVTGEVTPHHLSLTDAEVASYDPRFKVNPPLRPERDVSALRAGCGDGVVDAIATDHAPHPEEAKEEPFELAPPGMLGLETALSVAYEALVLSGACSLPRLFELLSTAPARICGLDRLGHGGAVEPSSPANLCVFDPAASFVVDAGRLASRSTNSPFSGRTLTGRVRHTLVAGEAVVIAGEAQR